MNGMVTNAWPYVIAAYGVTWTVLIGYAIRLWRGHARINALLAQATHER